MQHKFQSHRHRWVLTFTELPDRVVVTINVEPPKPSKGELRRFNRWSYHLFQAYEKDPRPFEFTNPVSGEVATVYGDADSGEVYISKRGDLH